MAWPGEIYDEMVFDNNLKSWAERFYVSIIESNLFTDLKKFESIFTHINILIDISKYEQIVKEPIIFQKLSLLEVKWRNNELTLKLLEEEFLNLLNKIKEKNHTLKILVLFSEIQTLLKEIKNELLHEDFYVFKENMIKKIELNSISSLEKKATIKRLENLQYFLLNKSDKKTFIDKISSFFIDR
ncbi:MAG: hypothetical protein JXA94_01680 [Parachlamydiales bacterium]|nr:hypothetical protein [Parachlamydiales bacterium]